MTDETVTQSRQGLTAGLGVVQIALGVLMIHQSGYLNDRYVAFLGGLVALTGVAVTAMITYRDFHRSPTVIDES